MNDKKILQETYKRQFLAGIINETKYDDLINQIAADFQSQLDYEKERDETYLLEGNKMMAHRKEKLSQKADAKKGKMKKILDIPQDEEVSDHYKSGKALVNALMSKIDDKKEVTGMLAFAANINKEEDVFDKALAYMKKLDESNSFDEKDFLSE